MICQDFVGGGIVVVNKNFVYFEVIMKLVNLIMDFLYFLMDDVINYKKEYFDEMLIDVSCWNNDFIQILMQVDYNDVLKCYYEDFMKVDEFGDVFVVQEDWVVLFKVYQEFKEKGNDVDVNIYGEYLF